MWEGGQITSGKGEGSAAEVADEFKPPSQTNLTIWVHMDLH